MTLRELMEGATEIVLVGDGESYGLRLVRHADGRIDMADDGCGDTGSDMGETTCKAALTEVDNWLRCVEWEDDRAEALAQARKALGLARG